MDRVFSGIQPSGIIHIGNYLGAIKNWVKIQHQYPSIFCIVDLHAMTIHYDVAKMPETVFNAAITNIACGLDPEVCKIFVQSTVKEHTELTWLLTTVTPYGDLTRMTQFKDKSEQHNDNINAGLFCYPMLMAADILVYKANRVPVGEDQLQHLELTREIARRFNNRFNTEFFPEPKSMLSETPRIMGLEGKYKMSKSLGNYISLEETETSLWDKLKTAKTDEQRVKRTDPGDPAKCNIYTLHTNFSSEAEVANVAAECKKAGIGCVDCKKILAKNLMAFINPIREKIEFYKAKPDLVKDILNTGTVYCTKLAGETMEEVKAIAGIKY